ncbi:MAG: hypothetical protein KKC37_09705 [Proteobacteria bacterium]|nr:hypothetical protein [Pseudomonadota bacterium]
MKRLLSFFLAVGLLCGLAASAAAFQVKIGGEVVTNIFYAIQSGNSYGNNDRRMPDLTSFVAELNGDSHFHLTFTSNDKTTGAYIQISVNSGPPHGQVGVWLDYMYGWYKFGRCTLTIGHTDTMFASEEYSPHAWLASGYFPGGGHGDGLKGFGKLYSGRFALIKLGYETGPWFFQVALGQAPTLNANNPAGVATVANTTFPRLDLAVQYSGKYFRLAPGFSIYLSEREPIAGASLADDRVLSYALALPFKISLGAFCVVGEVAFGRNYWQAQTYNPWVAAVYWGGLNDATRTKIEDTYSLSACLGLSYQVGNVTLWLSGGWVKTTDAGNDQNGAWRHGQNTRYAVVFSAPYKVNQHFCISPEIGYYYFGWNPTLDVGPGPGSMTADLGSAWLAGLRFVITF